MISTRSKLSRFVPLALVLAVAACDTAASPTGPAPGDARMAVAQSSGLTSITINAPSVSGSQEATVAVTLWVDGHPLGGKLLTLFVDGIAYDAKRGARLGTAKFTVSGLTAGVHTLSAEFLGDRNFIGSSGSASITVAP